jgi:hypothetical protein
MALDSLEGLVRSMPVGSMSEGVDPDRSSENVTNDENVPSGDEKVEEAPPRYDSRVFGGGMRKDG